MKEMIIDCSNSTACTFYYSMHGSVTSPHLYGDPLDCIVGLILMNKTL